MKIQCIVACKLHGEAALYECSVAIHPQAEETNYYEEIAEAQAAKAGYECPMVVFMEGRKEFDTLNAAMAATELGR